MDKGRVLAGVLGWLLTAAMTAVPAGAQEIEGTELPMCDPLTFEDLGPPPNAPPDDPVEVPSPDEDGGATPDDDATPPEMPEQTGSEGQVGDPEESHSAEPIEADCVPFVYEMAHPLATPASAGSPFGAIRDAGDRWHAGVDIASPKLTPVVAVADGTVRSVSTDPANVWVTILHDDGWISAYVHLNNDTHDTDDGLGAGVRPGLTAGDRVASGMVIGWVGDSGNAEETSAHLHFELRNPEGVPVDVMASLEAAAAIAEAAPFTGAFSDDDGTRSETWFHLGVSLGAAVWCGDEGLTVCPQAPAVRSTLLTWTRALVPDRLGEVVDAVSMDAESRLFADPGTMAPVLACDSPLFCDQVVTGSDLAAFLGTGLAVTTGPCAAPVGDVPLTREQLLRHLLREAGLVSDPPCRLIS